MGKDAPTPGNQPRWRWTKPRTTGPNTPQTPREALQALQSLDARIRPDFKRASGGGVLALILLGVAIKIGVHHDGRTKFVAIGAGIAFVLVGLIAVRSGAREVSRIARARASGAAGSGLYILSSVIGYILILLGVLQIADVQLGSLLVGGAVTGVVLGIAAQQSLGNFFAGLVLLFSRPFVPGDRIKIFTGALGGPFEGIVTESGLIYTLMLTESGIIKIPNAGLLAAAIAPVQPATPETAEPSGLQASPEQDR